MDKQDLTVTDLSIDRPNKVMHGMDEGDLSQLDNHQYQQPLLQSDIKTHSQQVDIPPTPDKDYNSFPSNQPTNELEMPSAAVVLTESATHPEASQVQPKVQSHPTIKPLLEAEPHINLVIPNNEPSQGPQQEAVSPSPQKSAITKVTLVNELNVFYWTKTKEIINQIAEKAKNSVDSVITTLDPGMKEYLYSGGNVNVIVITENDHLVSSIRDAFQSAFGRATVNPAPYNHPNMIVDYPIRLACGFQEAVTVAQEKIKKLRQNTSNVPQNQVIVAIQPTLIHVNNEHQTNISNDSATSKSYFVTYCLLIEDPVLSVTLKCFGQLIPIDQDVVECARKAKYPENFHDTQLGFAVSLDELMLHKLKYDPMCGFGDEYGCFWLREWAGIYETQLVQQLSLTLAYSYRRKWDDCARFDAVS